jgi:hypothetical protein
MYGGFALSPIPQIARSVPVSPYMPPRGSLLGGAAQGAAARQQRQRAAADRAWGRTCGLNLRLVRFDHRCEMAKLWPFGFSPTELIL